MGDSRCLAGDLLSSVPFARRDFAGETDERELLCLLLIDALFP